MLIYRLESRTGQGPYNGGVIYSRDDDKPSYLANLYGRPAGGADPHPAPGNDGLGYIEDREYFGFDSPEACCAWFFREDDDAERLLAWGLYVTVWDVDEFFVRYGGKQIVFVREEAHQIRNMTPIEFHEEVTEWQNRVRP